MDRLITNALVVDGTGGPAFPGAILLREHTIERVFWSAEEAQLPTDVDTFDAGGRVVAPGFIDPHNHSDLAPFIDPWMDCYLRQGVTTVVVGNCGWSASPIAGAPDLAEIHGVAPGDLDLSWDSFATYFERLDAARPAINLAALVGHGGVRQEVMGMASDAPSAQQMQQMQAVLDEAMRAGALGLSTGLIYAPNLFASTEEVAMLARVIEPHGGLYASHIRSEAESVFEAVAECIEIGRRAGVPAHVSHLKVEGKASWGRSGELLGVLDAARAAGADVSADQYPYTAWETSLHAFLPPWAPVAELAAILAADYGRLRRSVHEGEPGWESSVKGIGWDRVIVVGNADETLSGRSIAALAESSGEDPFEAFCRLLMDDPATSIIGHGMIEEDVRTIMARPDITVGSDGTATSPEGPLGRFNVHPRYYGTFPRVLARYVRDEGILTIEQAVAKMTSMTADRFKLGDRGRIRAGAVADLVCLDPATVQDCATYEEPHRYPEGIERVWVGGQVAWDRGSGNGARAGGVVRREGTF